MRAFIDTVETKEQAIASMQAHYDAGRIAQCTCYKKNRGRAFVCKYYGHYYSVERVHGIPAALVILEDEIFSGLSEAEARELLLLTLLLLTLLLIMMLLLLPLLLALLMLTLLLPIILLTPWLIMRMKPWPINAHKKQSTTRGCATCF